MAYVILILILTLRMADATLIFSHGFALPWKRDVKR